MNKLEEWIAESKLKEMLDKRDNERQKKIALWILAGVGAVAAIAAIAYGVYRFFAPDYLGDFDDFDEELEDYFSEEEEEE